MPSATRRIIMQQVCQPEAHNPPTSVALAASSSTCKGWGSQARPKATISSLWTVLLPQSTAAPTSRSSWWSLCPVATGLGLLLSRTRPSLACIALRVSYRLGPRLSAGRHQAPSGVPSDLLQLGSEATRRLARHANLTCTNGDLTPPAAPQPFLRPPFPRPPFRTCGR